MSAGRPVRAAATLAAALGIATAAISTAAEVRVEGPSAHAGAWGLEVSIGKDCVVPDELVLDGGSSPISGLHEACLELTARQAAVAGGALLRSGGVIVLGEGFSVPAGTDLTLEIVPAMGADFASVVDHSPIDETVYHAAFYLDLDALMLGVGDEIEHFTAYTASGVEVFRLTLRPDGAGGVELGLAARQDGGGWIQTAPGQEVPLSGGWSRIEVGWTAAAGAGELYVTVAGGSPTTLTALDNDAYAIETVRWGAVTGSIGASSGALRLDTFSSWR